MMPKDKPPEKPPEDDKTPALERRPPQRAPAPEGTVEGWAEKKGMLPKYLPVQGSPLANQRMNPDYWKLSVALAHRRWTGSERVTEAEFDAAVAEATGHIHR